MIKEFMTFVVQQLVSKPEEVVVSIIKKDEADLLEIKVASEDRGRIIGRDGRTIKSLRGLLQAVGADGKMLVELSR
jgi:predicted RNA-binding protein YlqC (UPF0109 family)